MTRIKFATIAMLALGLASCGKGGEEKKPEAKTAGSDQGITLEKAMIGAPKGSKPEVIRMQKVAGNWRSMPGVFQNKDESLLLTLSNDNKYTVEVRGLSPDGKMESVNVQARGGITWTKEGLLEGAGPGARPPIAGLSKWTASFPSNETMTLKGADGKIYSLSYKGL